MKNHTKTVVLLIGMVSCADAQDVENKTENEDGISTLKQSIIVNDFDVKQAGILHANVLNPSPIPDPNKNALVSYQRMKLSESTPRFSSRILVSSLCGISAHDTAHGSGILTSSSRITTAHHVAEGSVKYFDYEDREVDAADHYTIRFGSFDQSGRLKYRVSNLGEESPLLAQRLFSLGLDNWAKSSKTGVRSQLRRWVFRFDDKEKQPFISLVDDTTNPRKYEGQDIAVVKVKDDAHPLSNATGGSEEINNELQSGLFDFYQPGPFFEIAPVSNYSGDDDVCPNNNQTKLYTSMFHLYPESEMDHKIPISGEGYQDAMGARDDCGEPSIECWGDLTNSYKVSVDYKKCVYSTYDSISGTSGGGIFSRTCQYNGDGNYDSSSPIYEKIEMKGVLSFVVNKGTIGETGLWSTSPLYSYEERGVENLDDLGEGYTAYAAFDETVRKWSQRDTSYGISGDPFNPYPNQPYGDGCPGELDGNSSCIVKIKPSESTAYTSPNEELSYALGKHSSIDGTPNPNAVNGDANPDGEELIYNSRYVDFEKRLEEKGFDFVPCFDRYAPKSVVHPDEIISRTWYINFGMLQGFIGSANQAQSPEPRETSYRIDALSPVCVPWSSQSWISNWGWTRVYTNSLSRIKDALPLNGGHLVANGFLKLHSVLFRMYEIRVDTDMQNLERTAHPPSMKNCPPNYYLKGIKFLKSSGVNNSGDVVGITHVICQSHVDAYENSSGTIPKTLTLPLMADEEIYDYTFNTGERNYNIGANIGLNQNASWTHQEEDICDPGFGAVGYAIKRNPSTSNIEYLHLYCAKAPKGGTR